jgi:hypothetical protein
MHSWFFLYDEKVEARHQEAGLQVRQRPDIRRPGSR